MLNKMLAGAAIVSVTLLARPVLAEEVLAEYLTWLDARDIVTSKGATLKTFGAVLAQDRANYHRFGIRQELDTGDPLFGDRSMRAKLPQLYQAGDPVAAHIWDDVMSGRGHYVLIRVMGRNGKATHVQVSEGAG